jgi:hypothetical protein
MNGQNQFEEEKKEIPMPPAAQAKIRTMQSDLKSVQESGGQAPKPYLAELNPREIEKKEPTFQTSPQKTSTATASAPTPKPFDATQDKPKSKKTKIIFIILGILVLLVILGWLGYYLISLLPSQNQNKISIPENFSIPSASPEIKPETLTPVSIPTSTPENISNEKIILAPLTLENFKNTLKAATANIHLNNLKKITFLNGDQSTINLSDLLPLILPELAKAEIARFFSENFSLIIWVDKNGSWPVYILQLKPTAALIGAQTFIKERFESSTRLNNNFKYEWINDKLIITTSGLDFSKILEEIE